MRATVVCGCRAFGEFNPTAVALHRLLTSPTEAEFTAEFDIALLYLGRLVPSDTGIYTVLLSVDWSPPTQVYALSSSWLIGPLQHIQVYALSSSWLIGPLRHRCYILFRSSSSWSIGPLAPTQAGELLYTLSSRLIGPPSRCNVALFYGSSCANNGKGAVSTPQMGPL